MKWQVPFPWTEMKGKHEHGFDWWRRHSPQTAAIPIPLMKHRSTPFFARSLSSSKGSRTWHPTQEARIPQAPAAKPSTAPGESTRDFRSLVGYWEAGCWHHRSEWQTQATEGSYLGTGGFLPGTGLPLSCLSVAGGKGGFGILGKCSPRGLQSWEKGGVRNELSRVSTAHPACPHTDAPYLPAGAKGCKTGGKRCECPQHFSKNKDKTQSETKVKTNKTNQGSRLPCQETAASSL